MSVCVGEGHFSTYQVECDTNPGTYKGERMWVVNICKLSVLIQSSESKSNHRPFSELLDIFERV